MKLRRGYKPFALLQIAPYRESGCPGNVTECTGKTSACPYHFPGDSGRAPKNFRARGGRIGEERHISAPRRRA